MPVEFAVLLQEGVKRSSIFGEVERLARDLHMYLEEESSQELILRHHVPGTSSAIIQGIVLRRAHQLGFEDEKKGLFSSYEVSALRPDYFRRIGNTGILLEVERGKTTINNMDLLDLWKCHICQHARYLFLVVPRVRTDGNGRITQEFSHVRKRLASFFTPGNYVNVDAVFLFGY